MTEEELMLKEEMLKMLEEEYYPYLHTFDINMLRVKVAMALKPKYSLKEIMDLLHEAHKKAYLESTGITPIDYSQYNPYAFADDWQDDPVE